MWGSLARKILMLSSPSSRRWAKKVRRVSRVNIWSPPATLFLANQLFESLNEMGIRAKITHKAVVGLSRADLDIVLAPAFFAFPLTRLPRVVFQLEQATGNGGRVTPEYVDYMNNSLAVFEYSRFNVEGLIQRGVDPKKIHHVPLGGSTKVFSQSIRSKNQTLPREKRVMAYAWFSGSPRRERFLEYAIRQMPSLVVRTDIFGEEMAKELESSDVVVHINYNTPAILATLRLWESLSRGCQVVSEKALNWREDPYLLNLVRFVEEEEFDLIRDQANELTPVEAEDKERLKTIEASEFRFKSALARGLFSVGVIEDQSRWNFRL
jgi:hypothetical protein